MNPGNPEEGFSGFQAALPKAVDSSSVNSHPREHNDRQRGSSAVALHLQARPDTGVTTLSVNVTFAGAREDAS